MTRDGAPGDPFQAMRDAYDQAVKGWSKAMEQMVTSEQFAEASGRFLRQYVEMQEGLRTASLDAAQQLHLPTTDDLARLATLVINVERKVDEVSDEVNAISGRLAAIEATLAKLARPQPSRSRTRPAGK